MPRPTVRRRRGRIRRVPNPWRRSRRPSARGCVSSSLTPVKGRRRSRQTRSPGRQGKSGVSRRKGTRWRGPLRCYHAFVTAFRGADLHCHSTFSDGLESPAQLVGRGVDAGLSVLALSDHDAVHGLPEFEAAAKGTGLVTVTASELSTRCDGDDVHVLGLFLDPEEPELRARLAVFREDRDTRGNAMVEKLLALGMPLDIEEI